MNNKIITKLPLWEEGANKNHVKWDCIKENIDILYDNKKYTIVIKEYYKNKQRLEIALYREDNNYETWDWYIIGTTSFINCQFGKFLSKKLYQWLDENDTEFEIDYDKNKQKLNLDRQDINIISYSSNSKIYIKCKKCNSSILRIPNDITSNHGCGVCNNQIIIEGVNDISTVAPWLIKYFNDPQEAKEYSTQSGKKIKVRCPSCGNIKEMIISNLFRQGFSCIYCSDKISYPNKFAINILKQLNIGFETEYAPTWIKPKRYDFYFKLNNKEEYIIEMDGGWHSNDNKMSKRTKEESKLIDDYKDEMARLHGIEVIRVDCDYYGTINRFEYIKNSILNNNKLSKLFNLNKIDWIKGDEFANKNLIKESCQLKKDKPNYSTGDIAKILNVCTATIREYLKIGNNNNWCVYDANKESKIIQSKNVLTIKDKYSKSIEIFKENKSLGIFKSCLDLEEKSENLFGIKLSRNAISAVARGDRNKHKGFTFKYV